MNTILGFHPMNIVQLENYRQRLLGLEQELTAEVEDDAQSVVELDQSRMGRLSRMDALQGQQIALETQRRQQRKLQAVQGALLRIDSGEFGNCYLCEQAISEARLNFDPTVTRCIDCADKKDD